MEPSSGTVHHAHTTAAAGQDSGQGLLHSSHAVADTDEISLVHLALAEIVSPPETDAVAGTLQFAAERTGAAIAAALEGAYSMLDTGLAGLAVQHASFGGGASTSDAVRSGIRSGAVTADGKYVEIDATAKDGDGSALLGQLQALGLQHGNSFGAIAGGLLPVAAVADLAGIADLAFASEAMPVDHVGKVTTGGDHAMASDTARTAYGVDGSGIQVGVISDSFDALHGMSTDKATNDLPANTTILTDYSGSDATDEGRAMAQIVHDIAPGASISFATAYGDEASFANAIIALAQHGAKVIVDDVLYFAEPAYQEGIIAQAVDEVVQNFGVTYISAAGNNAHNGFESSFISSGISTVVVGRTETFAQLSTTSGMTQFLPVTMAANTGAYFVLDWAQPSASVSPGKGATSDLDLFLYNSSGTALSDIDMYSNSGEPPYAIANNIGGDPQEILFYYNDTGKKQTINLAVGLHSGSAPADFKVMVLDNGAGDTLGTSSLNKNDGTIYGHAAASDAIAVGAADYHNTPAYGVNPAKLESWSSEGPTSIYYDAAGNLLTSPVVEQNPAIVAPDGGATTVAGFPSFYGTSAAAPHAAAVAALMLQANSNLNASDIENLMKDSSIDMDDPTTPAFDKGFDAATGAGLLQANLAVAFAKTNVITADASHTVILGTHLADTIVAGTGVDTLTGGDGNDVFIFDMGDSGSGSGHRDRITDFSAGADTIDVSALGAFHFLGGTAFDGQADDLRAAYDAANNVTLIQIDTDGDKTSNFELELAGKLALTTDDFTISSLLVPLTLTGTDGVDDKLTGGPANDTLSGLGGNDTLIGGNGDDILNGGQGADQMAGGFGNDTYYVDDVRDVVTESSATVNYTPPAGFKIIGTADLDGDGQTDVLLSNPTTNALELQLIKNGAGQTPVVLPSWAGWTELGLADVNGDGHKDVLYQHGSTLYAILLNGTAQIGQLYPSFASADPVVALMGAGQGTDTVIASIDYTLASGVENLTLASGAGDLHGTGNAAANVILGNTGDNVIAGGAGVDTLTGGGGSDTFVLAKGDTGASDGTRDVITDFVHGTDKIDVSALDQFRFLGTGAFDGQADALHVVSSGGNTIVEGDIDGDKVADFGIQLNGAVTVTAGDLTDTSLLQALTLTGKDGQNDTLTGGRLGDMLSGLGGNDTLIGNDGDDTLDGGKGADQMTGGAGNDTYYVDDAGDVVTETAASGANTVNYTPPAGFTIIGTADLDGDGQTDVLLSNPTTNALELQLIKNGAGQTPVVLPSWAGWTELGLADVNHDGHKDVLYQHGSTLYAILLNGTSQIGQLYPSSATADPVGSLTSGGGSSQGTDTVIASIDYTLASGVENLTLASGAGDLHGTGNGLNNTIIGNTGDNVITGGAGADTLTGGGGVDLFAFGKGDSGVPPDTRDTITDFVHGTDKLDLSALGQFRFLGTAAFDGKADELHVIHSGGTTIVEGDLDGDRSADFDVELTGNIAISQTDLTSSSIFRPSSVTIVNDDDLSVDYSGIRPTVSAAGDVNHDGYGDFVIGLADSSNPNGTASGNAYVVYGTALGVPDGLSLADIDGTNGFKIWGGSPNEWLGYGADTAGDFNGDGVDDLLVSASWSYSAFRTDNTEAFLLYGDATQPASPVDTAHLDPTQGISFQTASPISGAVGSVASLGDVNADGIDDIIIGASNAGIGEAGIAYVVFGTTGAAPSDLTKLDGSTGFQIAGQVTLGAFGQTVAGAGDLNGDGIRDIVVAGNDSNNHLAIDVVFGHAGAFSQSLQPSQLTGANGFNVTGLTSNEGYYFNQIVKSAGDVNGDGYGDLIIGGNGGPSHVLFGHGGAYTASVDVSALNGTNGFTITAPAEETLGVSVASAGDLNGDGYADLIIGAPDAYSFMSTDPGHAYVLYGHAGGFAGTIDVSQINPSTGFVISGNAAGDEAGWSVSSAGDIDGDGLDDLLVASPGPEDGKNFGEVQVIYGHAAAGAFVGTDANDTLIGTAGANTLIGAQGNDTINGNGGADSIHGGAGDDHIHVSDSTFFRIDGGSGSDTLHLDFAGAIDLGNLDGNAATSDRGKISNIETIDLNNGQNNALTLHLADVLDMAVRDTDVGGKASLDNTLKIDGNTGDTLHLATADGWSAADTSTLAGYAIYTHDAVKVAIDTHIAVTVS